MSAPLLQCYNLLGLVQLMKIVLNCFFNAPYDTTSNTPM